MSETGNASSENQQSSILGLQILREYQVNSIEELITDDPSVRLEILGSEQLANVRLHFIGGTHSSEFESRWNKAAVNCRPDYIIMEGGTPTAAERHSAELIENLDNRNIPIHVQTPADNKIYRLRPERIVNNGWGGVPRSVGEHNNGRFPVVRLMDLALDEHPEMQRGYHEATGVPGAGANKTLLLMSGLSRPLNDVVADFRLAVAADVAFNSLREQRMIKDISIIVANASMRQPGEELSIAVLHGAHHTALYHYFARLGVPVTREFINDIEQHPGEKHHFGRMDTADREVQFRGRLQEKTARAAVIGRMVSVAAF